MLGKVRYFMFIMAIFFICQGIFPPEVDATEKEAGDINIRFNPVRGP